ncbi:hypothetical protein HYH02_003970 [Chlamydomonas schloesseri]|uniref:Uncharacterized protein n=1 Tax=Chlamydomonas schloesseri TaxID=2026947 RepID=A0A835WQA0_9CHLO|nr:hypothetical protein HYH02_003970 [Chlamydomonas schloesseri]|eukprot:KAG2451368.1 hypothetical protein HYH02_003970 [Chlamydomonas schloesseri]
MSILPVHNTCQCSTTASTSGAGAAQFSARQCQAGARRPSGLPTPELLSSRARAAVCARAASDWSGGGDGRYIPTDWSGVAPGAYADPRVAPLGPQQRPPYGPGGETGPSAGASTNSFDGPQDSDPLSEIARSAVDAVTGCLAFLVGRLSDAALSLLPSHVKRRAVENTVKGALALLGLALLQSVLSLVLTVGTLVLAVYAAYQVFGVQLPFLPPQPGSGYAGGGGAGGYGGSYRQDGPFASAGTQVDPRYAGTGGSYGPYAGPYQQQHPQQVPQQHPGGPGRYGPGPGQPYPGGYGGAYPPRPSGVGGYGPGPAQQRRQGPTIDVYWE